MPLLAIDEALGARSRWTKNLTRTTGITGAEILLLAGLGVLAAVATTSLRINVPIPGHAILRGVLPAVLGLALVPRYGAGSIISATAVCAGVLIHELGVGQLPVAAATGLGVIGPALDLVAARNQTRSSVVIPFMIAGIAANLIVLATRFIGASLGLQPAGTAATNWAVTAASYLACGAAAGLISALLAFRSLPDHSGARQTRP